MSWKDWIPGYGIPGVGNLGDLGAYLTEPGHGNDASRANLDQSGNLASDFADQSQTGYQQLGAEGAANRDYLRGLASGQNSVSAEQLRQGLGQNLAAQRSYAAGASPQNAAMAARTGAMNMGRLGYGMAGQQAIAGLAERNQAQNNLTGAIQGARGQDLQAALGSRQNAINAYGQTMNPNGDKSKLDQYMPLINAGVGAAGAAAKSDRRAKFDIKDGDKASKSILDGLNSYTYKYKNKKDGKGRQFGPMAQDMEKAGLGHAVMDTPDGKVVHGAKAALSSLALAASLSKRVSELEKKK